ncbi:MAG: divalent-cation tolerance protein CutA [Elusimicrobia bacterium]|nr:divalent-cation tolerance protein CutA [Elusimicrobiota bacterium]
MKTVVLLVSAPNARTARRLAEALVEERLAACVTDVPGAVSVYRWKGKVERTSEHLLLIKTRRPRLTDLVRRIKTLHPDDVPEILALPVVGGNSDYLDWLRTSTASPPRSRAR